MSRERTLNVAKAVTAQIHTTEEAIDTALGEAAHLIETFITSRRTLRRAAMMGNEAHDATIKAMVALHAAQQHMTDAHKALSRVQSQLGLEASAIIPPYDKPPEDEPTKPRGYLAPTQQIEQFAEPG